MIRQFNYIIRQYTIEIRQFIFHWQLTNWFRQFIIQFRQYIFIVRQFAFKYMTIYCHLVNLKNRITILKTIQQLVLKLNYMHLLFVILQITSKFDFLSIYDGFEALKWTKTAKIDYIFINIEYTSQRRYWSISSVPKG